MERSGRESAVDGNGSTTLLEDERATTALLDASRALVAVSARSIAATRNITLPQFRMLVILSRAPSNLTSLAEALDVAPSTALRMVDRLVAVAMVERAVRPENRRETIVSLTAAGRRCVASVTARRSRDLRALFDRIAPADRPRIVSALERLTEAAEELWPGIATRTP